MDDDEPGQDAGGPIGQVARQIAELLGTAAPDTGEDATQVALDDALNLLEDRLTRLAGGQG